MHLHAHLKQCIFDYTKYSLTIVAQLHVCSIWKSLPPALTSHQKRAMVDEECLVSSRLNHTELCNLTKFITQEIPSVPDMFVSHTRPSFH